MRLQVNIEIPDEIVGEALTAPDLDSSLIPFQNYVGVDGGIASVFFNDDDEALFKDDSSTALCRRMSRFSVYVDFELTAMLTLTVEDSRSAWKAKYGN